MTIWLAIKANSNSSGTRAGHQIFDEDKIGIKTNASAIPVRSGASEFLGFINKSLGKFDRPMRKARERSSDVKVTA